VYWENRLLVVLSLVFIVQLAWAAVGLSREMRLLAPQRRRVLGAVVMVPVAVIGLGIFLLIEASQLRPVISGSESVGHRLIHVWYAYQGHPLVARIIFGAGSTGIVGGWFGGTVLLVTMAARRRFPVQVLMTGVRRAPDLPV
jgi:hypothetical protein